MLAVFNQLARTPYISSRPQLLASLTLAGTVEGGAEQENDAIDPKKLDNIFKDSFEEGEISEVEAAQANASAANARVLEANAELDNLRNEMELRSQAAIDLANQVAQKEIDLANQAAQKEAERLQAETIRATGEAAENKAMLTSLQEQIHSLRGPGSPQEGPQQNNMRYLAEVIMGH